MIESYDATDPLNAENLKAKQRRLRDNFSEPLGLRVHRANSWLRRADAAGDDLDVRFITLWIGFNSAYAGDLDQAFDMEKSTGERARFDAYFAALLELDSDGKIYASIWERFSQEIRLLLDNRYVFSPFWKFQSCELGGESWELRFNDAKRAANTALASNNSSVVLSIVFDRLYVLRNQLVHGGATWNSTANRSQLRDGVAILSCLLPIFIDIMMENADREWTMPNYPVVND